MIPTGYYEWKKKVELTQAEIDKIIEELERTEHNLFVYLQYDKLIKKLKEEK